MIPESRVLTQGCTTCVCATQDVCVLGYCVEQQTTQEEDCDPKSRPCLTNCSSYVWHRTGIKSHKVGRLLSVMNHELPTPLHAAIIGFTQDSKFVGSLPSSQGPEPWSAAAQKDQPCLRCPACAAPSPQAPTLATHPYACMNKTVMLILLCMLVGRTLAYCNATGI